MPYDVVIIGAGPAGLFAAHEIAKNSKLKVLVLDLGRDVSKRICPQETTAICATCDPCNVMTGIGGCGVISDGILNLRPDIGGDLRPYTKSNKEAWDLVDYVDKIYVKHGAPEKLSGIDGGKGKILEHKAMTHGVEFIQIPQRHIGSDYAKDVISSFCNELKGIGVELRSNTMVESIGKGFVKLRGGKKIYAKYILAAPGRYGAKWLAEQAKALGIKAEYGPIDVGVRVELPADIMESVCEINRDPKFRMRTKTFEDYVRTFCVNHRGFVVEEVYEKHVGVNGHSLRDKQTENTNFAFLVRIELTEPVEDTIKYGKSIAMLATTIGGGKPVLQRLVDLKLGRRSTWARLKRSIIEPTLKDVTPGDISMALPHRIVTDIIEGLEKLDEVIPGIDSDSTLLYAPEVKFYAMRFLVDHNMETNVPNLFVAGDGAGVSRDIINASATGILAGRGILRKAGAKIK